MPAAAEDDAGADNFVRHRLSVGQQTEPLFLHSGIRPVRKALVRVPFVITASFVVIDQMSSDAEAHKSTIFINRVEIADLESHLNSEFTVDPNYVGINIDGTPLPRDDVYPTESDIRLKLVEVTRLKPFSRHLRQDPVTLLFVGPHEFPLHTEMHVVSHPTLGRLSLFLSPVNAEPGIHPEHHPQGRFYESHIN